MAMPAPEATGRIAARLTNRFALDLVKLGGFGRDVIDGLLLMAISQANVAQISRSPELQRAYATLDQIPSDDLRRPVSMSAIANSLCIPFETTRRRIQSWAKLGLIQSTPRGVIVPQAPLSSPFYRVGAEGNYMLVRTLYFHLRTIGLLDQLPRPNSPVFDPKNPPGNWAPSATNRTRTVAIPPAIETFSMRRTPLGPISRPGNAPTHSAHAVSRSARVRSASTSSAERENSDAFPTNSFASRVSSWRSPCAHGTCGQASGR